MLHNKATCYQWRDITKYKYSTFHVSVLYLSRIICGYFRLYFITHKEQISVLSTPLNFYTALRYIMSSFCWDFKITFFHWILRSQTSNFALPLLTSTSFFKTAVPH